MQKLLTVLFGLTLVAAPAAAQDYKPVDINFGFGWQFPSGDFKQSFDAGWNGTIGATYNINEHMGIMADYTYSRMEGPDKQILVSASPVAAALTNGVIQSNHQMHVGTFDFVYKAQSHDHPFGGYGLGGLGIYHRIVQLTSPTVGYTSVCDPYWYVCYPTLVSVDQILGDRSSNDFGINFGGGLTFGHEGKFYVESRIHYVWGRTINPTATQLPATAASAAVQNCSGGCTTNTVYYPLTFGFRW